MNSMSGRPNQWKRFLGIYSIRYARHLRHTNKAWNTLFEATAAVG